VVYVMRGAFARHHLLAGARRLSYVLRGRRHQPGLDEQIVQMVVDDYTRLASRRMTTADLRTLYPRDTEDQAVLRPLTRKRTAPPYERARLAADALAAGSTRYAVRNAWAPAPSRAPSPCPPPRGRARGRSVPARRTAASWSRRPASTRWSRPAGPSKPPPGWPPGSRTASGSAPAPTALGHNPPRRRPRSRTPSSPAPSTHRAGPQEESHEHPGRTPQPR
jgi:hypothetical protein